MNVLNLQEIDQVSGAGNPMNDLINATAGAYVGSAAATLLVGIDIGGLGIVTTAFPLACAGAIIGACFGLSVSHQMGSSQPVYYY